MRNPGPVKGTAQKLQVELGQRIAASSAIRKVERGQRIAASSAIQKLQVELGQALAASSGLQKLAGSSAIQKVELGQRIAASSAKLQVELGKSLAASPGIEKLQAGLSQTFEAAFAISDGVYAAEHRTDTGGASDELMASWSPAGRLRFQAFIA